MYYTDGASINLYARPIEGMQAIIDLDDRRVLQVLDSGVVPVPTATHEFDEASVGALVGLRPALKPLRVTQPDGANFRIDGNFVEWQKWRFHVRFERRAGPVISLVTYDRALGALPGLAGRDLRALPGPERQLVLPHLHGRRRVRLRAAGLAADARARRAGQRRAARCAGGRGPARPRACRWCRCRCRAWSASSSASPATRRGATSRASAAATKGAPRSSWWCAASRRSATTTT